MQAGLCFFYDTVYGAGRLGEGWKLPGEYAPDAANCSPEAPVRLNEPAADLSLHR